MSPNIAAVLIGISASTLVAVVSFGIRLEHRLTRLEVRMDVTDKVLDVERAQKITKLHSGGLC
jgi:hypothetical protein